MAGIFSKIIQGEIPSYKIYENELVYAFLDINPIRGGHTLIVPKIEIDYFLDVPEPHYCAVFKAAQVVGKAIHAATKCKRVGSTVQGFEIPHFHLHLVPMWGVSDLDFRNARSMPAEELKQMQEKILAQLVGA